MQIPESTPPSTLYIVMVSDTPSFVTVIVAGKFALLFKFVASYCKVNVIVPVPLVTLVVNAGTDMTAPEEFLIDISPATIAEVKFC